MKDSLATRIFLTICLLGSALGSLEIVTEWDGGYQADLGIVVQQQTNGWRLELEFERNVNELEVFTAVFQSLQGSSAVIVNADYNANLPPNSQLTVEFLVRYASGQGAVRVASATFNGQPVDVGNGVGPTNPPSNTTTTTTTRRPGQPGPYDYGEVIGKSLLFYEAQRTGKLPANNRIPWRGDSFLQDGQDVGLDLTGGYFDAGDHVKFGFPMAAMTTVMAWGLIEFKQGYVAAGELQNAEAAVRWSLDYFIKAHPSANEFYGQLGDGNVDHAFWGRPEEFPSSSARPAFKISANAPGSDLAGEAAASFAAGYLVFKDSDASYAATLLRHGRELYDFANQYRGTYVDAITNAGAFYNSWSGYGDELGWAAAWLYRATGEEKYLNDFKAHWNEFGLGGRPAEFGWDDKKAGLQVLMSIVTKDPTYTSAAQAFCNFIVNDVQRTPKGLVYVSEWGSLRHASNVVFVCLAAAEAGINANAYRDFARSQIHYILGDGGRSYVVGYGNNPPTRPHHRASSCPNRPAVCDWNSGMSNPGANWQTLTGALVGGPGAQDNYEDDRNDYVKNEVATDYNAGFQGALAALNQL